MSFHHRALHYGQQARWICIECGATSTGKTCRACSAPRDINQEEALIVAQLAREDELKRTRNPRTWACLARLEVLAMDDPDAGVRDRATTWLCAVNHAAEQGQEMSQAEVEHVLDQIGVRAQSESKAS